MYIYIHITEVDVMQQRTEDGVGENSQKIETLLKRQKICRRRPPNICWLLLLLLLLYIYIYIYTRIISAQRSAGVESIQVVFMFCCYDLMYVKVIKLKVFRASLVPSQPSEFLMHIKHMSCDGWNPAKASGLTGSNFPATVTTSCFKLCTNTYRHLLDSLSD